MTVLEKAIAIAVQAHAGQKDKAGAPYVLHPLRMMLRLDTELERTVAVLHDVVEDGPGWSFERLRAEGIPEEAVAILDKVTARPEEKGSDEAYAAFVERAAGHPVARRVKIADIEDNMDLRRLSEFSENTERRLRKYLRSWRYLREREARG